MNRIIIEKNLDLSKNNLTTIDFDREIEVGLRILLHMNTNLKNLIGLPTSLRLIAWKSGLETLEGMDKEHRYDYIDIEENYNLPDLSSLPKRIEQLDIDYNFNDPRWNTERDLANYINSISDIDLLYINGSKYLP